MLPMYYNGRGIKAYKAGVMGEGVLTKPPVITGMECVIDVFDN